MIIPILILISSILFLGGIFHHNFPNSTKNLFLNLKKPFFNSPAPPLHQDSLTSSSPEIENISRESYMNKEGDFHSLKKVFDTFDKNGDGFITRQELRESLSKIGFLVSAEEIEEMVEKLDSNRDGLIDVSEFRELFGVLKGKEKKEEEENEEDDDNKEGELKEAFDVFDGDRDGLITVEELGKVLSSLGLKEGKRVEDCKEMIRKVDVDGDGMVNFDEFKKMMKSCCLIPAF